MISKPIHGTFPEYFNPYIKLVPDEIPIITYLESQRGSFINFLKNEVKPIRQKTYEHGKWTCQDLFGHLLDTERILSFRALFIARGDKQNLPGFEQDDYVNSGEFLNRDFDEMIDEFSLLRSNTIQLLKSFPLHLYDRKAKINGFETALAAIPFIIAGHVAHHEFILKERYIS